jgi:hypothetical protein
MWDGKSGGGATAGHSLRDSVVFSSVVIDKTGVRLGVLSEAAIGNHLKETVNLSVRNT